MRYGYVRDGTGMGSIWGSRALTGCIRGIRALTGCIRAILGHLRAI